MNEFDLFAAAIAIADPAEQDSFLDRECDGNLELRLRLNQLISAHRHAHAMLDRPKEAAVGETDLRYSPTVNVSGHDARPGSVIVERYKLLERIGEGGMGEVWVADQMEPIRRRIAVKLIKPGMDSRSLLARFEAERQALAVMDHPNIAKVLDAGTTADGRPYFAMELVKGTPITEFCDARRLTPNQRLELFVPVCQAIQHAHSKGIIHRDIKPSNVLVALHDERAVPKVIDFGVAKAIGQQLTEKTIYTGFGSLVGTPVYMAPEQATFNQIDIDTRADVYSLGVLLYELLAGSPPIEKERLKKAAIDEVLRLVRDEEPPRPSQRLSTSQARASIAATRQSDPSRLAQFIRGELDWIVMKALEKDRNRRYDTANGFAADVQRYLAGEAVQAVPPSKTYRLRKFARRNRSMLTTMAAFVALLVGAAIVSGWLAVTARRAEALAEERRDVAIENATIAQDYAEEAGYLLGFLHVSLENETAARQNAEISAMSLQIDIELNQSQSDPRIGLLQMANRLSTWEAYPTEKPFTLPSKGITLTVSANEEVLNRQQKLREFVAAAILINGQAYASLLPPITHDGIEVIDWQIDSTGERLITLGKDGTSRLWNTETHRPIAALQKGNEHVLRCGFSPDGKTAFTDALDGVVRIWNTTDGSYRVETEPRPGHVCPEYQTQYAGINGSSNRTTDVTHISNDRLITRSVATGLPERLRFVGPIELWDTQTGRLVSRFEVNPIPGEVHYHFAGNGRWVFEADSATISVFDSGDGQCVAKLQHAVGHELRSGPFFSNNHPFFATVSQASGNTSEFYVYLWNSQTWQLMNVTGPCQGPHFPPNSAQGFINFNGELFAFNGDNRDNVEYPPNRLSVYRFGDNTRMNDNTLQNVLAVSPQGDRVLMDNGLIMNTKTWQRVAAPAGNRYPPDLIQFAPDQRFAFVNESHMTFSGINRLIDISTEKAIPTRASWSYSPRIGWIAFSPSGKCELQRLPLPEQLAIPPDLMELWTQVAVRGQLSPTGEFMKWDERTWETKRQELAAKPTPIADFPFPGYVASDKLHWLRGEFNDAKSNVEKAHWVSELLSRAEVSDNRIEIVKWRAEQERLSEVPGETK